mmetsp:Transcript_4844/g.13576  ORF Transcript_4844/g.13576 Transcript_4844/m.13576 type:complete len:358 (+) Transcript_4844:390-1463(+)
MMRILSRLAEPRDHPLGVPRRRTGHAGVPARRAVAGGLRVVELRELLQELLQGRSVRGPARATAREQPLARMLLSRLNRCAAGLGPLVRHFAALRSRPQPLEDLLKGLDRLGVHARILRILGVLAPSLEVLLGCRHIARRAAPLPLLRPRSGTGGPPRELQRALHGHLAGEPESQVVHELQVLRGLGLVGICFRAVHRVEAVAVAQGSRVVQGRAAERHPRVLGGARVRRRVLRLDSSPRGGRLVRRRGDAGSGYVQAHLQRLLSPAGFHELLLEPAAAGRLPFKLGLDAVDSGLEGDALCGQSGHLRGQRLRLGQRKRQPAPPNGAGVRGAGALGIHRPDAALPHFLPGHLDLSSN